MIISWQSPLSFRAKVTKSLWVIRKKSLLNYSMCKLKTSIRISTEKFVKAGWGKKAEMEIYSHVVLLVTRGKPQLSRAQRCFSLMGNSSEIQQKIEGGIFAGNLLDIFVDKIKNRLTSWVLKYSSSPQFNSGWFPQSSPTQAISMSLGFSSPPIFRFMSFCSV
jgi:hypothetical protein